MRHRRSRERVWLEDARWRADSFRFVQPFSRTPREHVTFTSVRSIVGLPFTDTPYDYGFHC